MKQSEAQKQMKLSFQVEEHESTISIPIKKFEFIQAQKTDHRVDILFFFDDDVTRLAQRNIQQKKIVKTRNLLSFYDNKWFPIKRTSAIETLCSIPTNLNVVKARHRIIVEQQNGIRVSYNKEETRLGDKYSLDYEIEYPSGTTYDDILKAEERLMKRVNDDERLISRQELELEDVFKNVNNKVQMWHCFKKEEPYKWAYKHNGIKCKLVVKQGKDGEYSSILWPDGNKVTSHECDGDNLSLLTNLCLLVEEMSHKFVILEVVGAKMNDDIYTTEPRTTLNILAQLRKLITNVRIGQKFVEVQKFFDPPRPRKYPEGEYDGFIIIQRDLVIKWKYPTIDVKCISPYTFVIAGTVIALDANISCNEGETGKIFEVSCDFTVLRQRTDRHAASTEEEWKTFLKSITFLGITQDEIDRVMTNETEQASRKRKREESVAKKKKRKLSRSSQTANGAISKKEMREESVATGKKRKLTPPSQSADSSVKKRKEEKSE